MTTATTPAAPAPANGAAKTTPQTPAAPLAPPPATAEHPELKAAQDRAAKAEAEAQRYKREEIINRRKTDGERKTFAEKLKAADEYAQLQKHAGINPAAVAKKLWGDQWYEKLTAINVNGGAPTADSIAFEIEQREQALEKKFADRETERAQQAQEAQQRRVEAQLRAFTTQAVDFAKESAKDYPLFERFKSPERVAGAIVNRIRAEHDATVRRDPETHEVLRPGRVMTFKEAADAIEAELYGIAEHAVGTPKFADQLRAKLTPTKTPATVPPVVKSSQASQQGSESSQSSSQARRTLGNDLTGSTPAAPPKYRTEAQRTADALAAYERTKKA